MDEKEPGKTRSANTTSADVSLADSLASELSRENAGLARVGLDVEAVRRASRDRRDKYASADPPGDVIERLARGEFPTQDESVRRVAAERLARYEEQKAVDELRERFGRIVDGYAECGLPARYVTGEKTLDTYEAHTDSQRRAIERTRSFLTALVKPGEPWPGMWLYYHSDEPGVGKTHLAAALAAEFIRKGGRSRFITAADLVLWARLDTQLAAEAVQFCRRAQFLVLDDFGAEKMTEFSIGIIGQILNARYEARRPMAFTSNYSLGALGERIAVAGEEIAARRIVDRMAEMTVGAAMGVIKIDGKSRR